MAKTKGIRKRDVLLWVVIIAAVFAAVFILSEIIEHLPQKGYDRQDNDVTTAGTVENTSDDNTKLPSEGELWLPEDDGPPADARPANADVADEDNDTLPENTEGYIADSYTASGYNNNIKHIVLLGVDKNELGENDTYRTGGQCDVILILSLNLKNKEYFILSINRDLAVPVENYSAIGGSYGIVDEQIALSYAYGDGGRASGRNTIKSLKALLGDDMKFLGYIAAPIPIVSTLADSVGGVEVTIEDDFTGIDDTLIKGETVNLMGEHAETFVRSRMYMPDDTHNTKRMTRQIQFMEAFVKKVKNTMTAQQVVNLYDDTLDMVMTDMGKSDITKWILTGYDYEYKGTYRIDGTEGERKHDARCTYYDPEEVEELVHQLYYK